MLIPAAIGVAAMNSAFLAGSSSMQLQWPSAIVVGIIAALGLCILLVAGGITWKSLPPVSIMAFGLFGLCLWLALQAAGGFSYFTSRPLPIHENPLRFDNEPRHIEAIDRDISRFLSQEREYRGERGGWVVTNGAEILSRTDQCAAFHHIWEHSQCEQFRYLQTERKKAAKLYGETTAGDGLSMGAVFSPGALSFGRYFSAWYIHFALVAFTALCLPILFGCGYALMGGTVPASTPTGGALIAAQKSRTEQAFEAWAAENIVRDSNTDTPTELLRLAYRLSCLAKGWPEYNGEAFGRKMASWAKDELKTFERDSSKKIPAYVGITLAESEITKQARRSYENGNGAS